MASAHLAGCRLPRRWKLIPVGADLSLIPVAGPTRPIDILLVEDNAADVALTRQVLQRSHLVSRLMVARDGEEALATLRREGSHVDAPRPDFVLLDLNMPRMSGLEVLEVVKASPDLCAIPVLVLTSSVAEDDVQRAYSSHVNAYVRKPMDLASLADLVDAIDRFWCTMAVLPSHQSLGRRG
jgi:CheY-like chemotaxis protein